MPGNRCRTIASAQRTPNTVFSGTAASVTSTVSFSAWTAVGFEIACQKGTTPCSNARQKIKPTGAIRISARYASDPVRTTRLAVMTRGPTAQAADSEEDAERDHEHEHGE